MYQGLFDGELGCFEHRSVLWIQQTKGARIAPFEISAVKISTNTNSL